MIRVRPALLSDLEGIRAVSLRNGLSSFDPEERRNWCLSHPFRKEFEGIPMGWVLESKEKEIVGTFSNIHMMYELDGKCVKCGVAGSWGVDVEHRNSSLLLAMAFFSQKNVDFCFTGSASSVSSRLMQALQVQRIPSEDYDLSYFWIARPKAFAAAVLRKKKIPAVAALAPLISVGLRAADLGFGGFARKVAGLMRFDKFGKEFDVFWDKLRQKAGRLRAIRTSQALEWRFRTALNERRAVVLGLLKSKELLGYVVLREKDREHLQLRQFVIADLQALNDSPDTILDLLAAALETTREQELDVLEWQGWNPVKRRLALSAHPRSYRYPVWPLFCKTINQEFAPALARPDTWDFSPFDAF